MKLIATVRGVKRSKGVLDNGKEYDNTTLYVEFPFDESSGSTKGAATQDLKWGLSGNYELLKDVQCPFEAELNIEMVTSGKKISQIVTEVKPLNAAQGKTVKAA